MQADDSFISNQIYTNLLAPYIKERKTYYVYRYNNMLSEKILHTI